MNAKEARQELRNVRAGQGYDMAKIRASICMMLKTGHSYTCEDTKPVARRILRSEGYMVYCAVGTTFIEWGRWRYWNPISLTMCAVCWLWDLRYA